MLKYIAGTIGLLLVLSPLYALDVQVGSFLRVEHIAFRKGKVVLPVERRKYHNIRILDKETFLQVNNCQEQALCQLSLEKMTVKVESVRAVKTRADMQLAEVSFADKWIVTFLVFKNEEGFSVRKPKYLIFTDTDLEKEVTKQIKQVLL